MDEPRKNDTILQHSAIGHLSDLAAAELPVITQEFDLLDLVRYTLGAVVTYAGSTRVVGRSSYLCYSKETGNSHPG